MKDVDLYPLPSPEIFEELTLGDRAVLRAMSCNKPIALDPHAVLAAADMPDDRVYCVRSGWLARIRWLADGRRQIVGFLLRTDLVGLQSMLMPREAHAVEALTPAVVDSLDAAQFRKLAVTNAAVALRVMYQFAQDERRLHNWMTVLGHGKHVERVAAALLDLWLRLRRLDVARRSTFCPPLTPCDIADYVGLHVVHANRAIRQLREQGLLSLVNGKVVVHDLAGLERIARPMLDASGSAAVEMAPMAE